jgi:uncharacterized protein YcfJ
MLNKSMLIGLAGGAAAATAIGGIASYEVSHRGAAHADYAEVVSVQQVFKEVRLAHKVCGEVPVTREAPVKDQNRLAGTAIGAVLGGILGDQVGNGNGRTVAAIAGAAAGGYAGNTVQKNMQQSDRQTVMEERCRMEYSNEKQPLGYNVTYHLDGKQHVVRMDHDPGPRIPVKDGHLVLSQQGPRNPS